MSDSRDSAPKDPVASLRDELGEEFVRIARQEPRFRLRRRLRYAGLGLIGALLIVPAAVALSGEPADRTVREAELGSLAACAGVRVIPPAETPASTRLRTLRPSFQELEPAGKSAPRLGTLRELDRENRLSESCALPASPPVSSRAKLPSEVPDARCVVLSAENGDVIPRRLAYRECPRASREVQALPPAGAEPPDRTRPPALRAECLTFRVNGDVIEAGPCPLAEIAPAPRP
jgi:hypothetical protein